MNKYTIATLILVILAGARLGGLLQFSILQGFTVTGVSLVDSYEPALGVSKYWLVSVSANGGGSELIGTLSTDQIISGTAKALYPLNIRMYNLIDYAKYQVVNDAEEIYKYQVIRKQRPNFWSSVPSCDASILSSWDSKYYPVTYDLTNYVADRWCLYRYPIAIKGHIDKTGAGFEGLLALTSNGKVAESSISSEKPSVVLLEGSTSRAVVKWVGSYSSLNDAPEAKNYISIAPLDTKNWQFTSTSTYSNYLQQSTLTESELRVLLYSDLTSMSPDSLNSRISDATEKLNGASDQTLSSWVRIGNIQSWMKGGQTTQDSMLRVQTGYPLQYPALTFSIDAAWIGVSIPIGKPKIISVSAPEFGSGETGNIRVTVQNIGDADGSFYAKLDSSKFTQLQSSGNVFIKKGESGTIILQVSGGTSNLKISDVGTITVYDYNNPLNFDRTSITLTMNPAKVCTPNAESVEGNNVFKCNAEGTSKTLIKTCQYGVKYVNGKYECLTSGETPPSTVVPTLPPSTTATVEIFTDLEVAMFTNGYFEGNIAGSGVKGIGTEEGAFRILLDWVKNLAGLPKDADVVAEDGTFILQTPVGDVDKLTWDTLRRINVKSTAPFSVYLNGELVKSNVTEYSYTPSWLYAMLLLIVGGIAVGLKLRR